MIFSLIPAVANKRQLKRSRGGKKKKSTSDGCRPCWKGRETMTTTLLMRLPPDMGKYEGQERKGLELFHRKRFSWLPKVSFSRLSLGRWSMNRNRWVWGLGEAKCVCVCVRERCAGVGWCGCLLCGGGAV
jgi:hypothetical protein